MEVVLTTSKKPGKNTMPELMALKLLVLARGASDFTKHKNPDRKDLYIDRHKKNEDWTKSGAKADGFYSKHVPWNKPTLKASIDDINNRFKSLNIKMK